MGKLKKYMLKNGVMTLCKSSICLVAMRGSWSNLRILVKFEHRKDGWHCLCPFSSCSGRLLMLHSFSVSHLSIFLAFLLACLWHRICGGRPCPCWRRHNPSPRRLILPRSPRQSSCRLTSCHSNGCNKSPCAPRWYLPIKGCRDIVGNDLKGDVRDFLRFERWHKWNSKCWHNG